MPALETGKVLFFHLRSSILRIYKLKILLYLPSKYINAGTASCCRLQPYHLPCAALWDTMLGYQLGSQRTVKGHAEGCKRNSYICVLTRTEGAQNNRNLCASEIKHFSKLLNSVNSAYTALQLDLKLLFKFSLYCFSLCHIICHWDFTVTK